MRSVNAFDRFRLVRPMRAGGRSSGGIPPTEPPIGNFVTWDPPGESGDGPHYTITDDDERITWDDPGA